MPRRAVPRSDVPETAIGAPFSLAPLTAERAEPLPADRVEDQTEDQPPVAFEGDRDGEVREPVGEVRRPVEGVDEPAVRARGRPWRDSSATIPWSGKARRDLRPRSGAPLRGRSPSPGRPRT